MVLPFFRFVLVHQPKTKEKAMKTKIEMKAELASVVARKREATKARLDYKHAPTRARGCYDPVIDRLWGECRNVGDEVRFAGLAYAFVRGRRYWVTERSCRNAPSAYLIAKISDAPEADVKTWLAEKPTADEVAAWEAHVRETKERALARKAERRSAYEKRAAE